MECSGPRRSQPSSRQAVQRHVQGGRSLELGYLESSWFHNINKSLFEQIQNSPIKQTHCLWLCHHLDEANENLPSFLFAERQIRGSDKGNDGDRMDETLKPTAPHPRAASGDVAQGVAAQVLL